MYVCMYVCTYAEPTPWVRMHLRARLSDLLRRALRNNLHSRCVFVFVSIRIRYNAVFSSKVLTYHLIHHIKSSQKIV